MFWGQRRQRSGQPERALTLAEGLGEGWRRGSWGEVGSGHRQGKFWQFSISDTIDSGLNLGF